MDSTLVDTYSDSFDDPFSGSTEASEKDMTDEDTVEGDDIMGYRSDSSQEEEESVPSDTFSNEYSAEQSTMNSGSLNDTQTNESTMNDSTFQEDSYDSRFDSRSASLSLQDVDPYENEPKAPASPAAGIFGFVQNALSQFGLVPPSPPSTPSQRQRARFVPNPEPVQSQSHSVDDGHDPHSSTRSFDSQISYEVSSSYSDDGLSIDETVTSGQPVVKAAQKKSTLEPIQEKHSKSTDSTVAAAAASTTVEEPEPEPVATVEEPESEPKLMETQESLESVDIEDIVSAVSTTDIDAITNSHESVQDSMEHDCESEHERDLGSNSSANDGSVDEIGFEYTADSDDASLLDEQEDTQEEGGGEEVIIQEPTPDTKPEMNVAVTPSNDSETVFSVETEQLQPQVKPDAQVVSESQPDTIDEEVQEEDDIATPQYSKYHISSETEMSNDKAEVKPETKNPIVEKTLLSHEDQLAAIMNQESAEDDDDEFDYAAAQEPIKEVPAISNDEDAIVEKLSLVSKKSGSSKDDSSIPYVEYTDSLLSKTVAEEGIQDARLQTEGSADGSQKSEKEELIEVLKQVASKKSDEEERIRLEDSTDESEDIVLEEDEPIVKSESEAVAQLELVDEESVAEKSEPVEAESVDEESIAEAVDIPRPGDSIEPSSTDVSEAVEVEIIPTESVTADVPEAVEEEHVVEETVSIESVAADIPEAVEEEPVVEETVSTESVTADVPEAVEEETVTTTPAIQESLDDEALQKELEEEIDAEMSDDEASPSDDEGLNEVTLSDSMDDDVDDFAAIVEAAEKERIRIQEEEASRVLAEQEEEQRRLAELQAALALAEEIQHIEDAAAEEAAEQKELEEANAQEVVDTSSMEDREAQRIHAEEEAEAMSQEEERIRIEAEKEERRIAESAKAEALAAEVLEIEEAAAEDERIREEEDEIIEASDVEMDRIRSAAEDAAELARLELVTNAEESKNEGEDESSPVQETRTLSIEPEMAMVASAAAAVTAAESLVAEKEHLVEEATIQVDKSSQSSTAEREEEKLRMELLLAKEEAKRLKSEHEAMIKKAQEEAARLSEKVADASEKATLHLEIAKLKEEAARMKAEQQVAAEAAEKERLRLELQAMKEEAARMKAEQEEASSKEQKRIEAEEMALRVAAEKERIHLEEEEKLKEEEKRLLAEKIYAEKERQRAEDAAARAKEIKLRQERLREETEKEMAAIAAAKAAEKKRLQAAEKARLKAEAAAAEKERLRVAEENERKRIENEKKAAEEAEKLKVEKEAAMAAAAEERRRLESENEAKNAIRRQEAKEKITAVFMNFEAKQKELLAQTVGTIKYADENEIHKDALSQLSSSSEPWWTKSSVQKGKDTTTKAKGEFYLKQLTYSQERMEKKDGYDLKHDGQRNKKTAKLSRDIWWGGVQTEKVRIPNSNSTRSWYYNLVNHENAVNMKSLDANLLEEKAPPLKKRKVTPLTTRSWLVIADGEENILANNKPKVSVQSKTRLIETNQSRDGEIPMSIAISVDGEQEEMTVEKALSKLTNGITSAISSIEKDLASSEDRVTFKNPIPNVAQRRKLHNEEILKKHKRRQKAVDFDYISPKPQIMDLIESLNSPSVTRRCNAAGTLKLMASQKKNVTMLASTDGLVQTILKASMINPDLEEDPEQVIVTKKRLLTALALLCQAKDTRKAICYQSGLLDFLLHNIKENTGEIRLHCCSAIAALAKTEENREFIANKDDMVAELSSMVLNLNEHVANKEGVKKSSNSAMINSSTRLNACASLLHLSKQCAVAAKMCKSEHVLNVLSSCSLDLSDQVHSRCMETIYHLSRFPGNTDILAENSAAMNAINSNCSSISPEDRMWSLRAMQNISAYSNKRAMFATKDTLANLCKSAQKMELVEEHEAAISIISNLCTDPSSAVVIVNAEMAVKVLVMVANDIDYSPEIQVVACDALATLSMWLQRVARAATVPENYSFEPLPTLKTTGYMRYNTEEL